jgi:hypothetical protein
MARTAALALAFLALMAGPAQATGFEIVVVPGLGLADLETVQDRGAVGLLNPGAGPETSAALAEASLVRGEVRNSLRGGRPGGPALVGFRTGALGSAEGPAIYLALPRGGLQPNDRRYPIVVLGHGYHGILTSEATKIPGLVSVADVAPTTLGGDGALGSEEKADGVAALGDLDARIDENNDARLPSTLLACALVLGLAVLFPRAAIPGFAAALLANLLLGIAGISGFWDVLAVLGVAVAIGGPLLGLLLRTPLALGGVLFAVLCAYLLALGVDGTVVALSPLGPTQNSRYYGLSNLLETMLLVPALAGGALLYVRSGWAGVGLTALVSFVTVAGNRFGADGGGALVLAAGFACLVALLAGGGGRGLALAGGVGLALAVGLLVLDAATGASSHVTRALESGPAGLARDLGERLELSWERATSSWGVALAVAALLVAFVLFVTRTLRRSRPRADAAAPLALAAAVGVSLLVNDSPTDVLLVGTSGFAAVAASMLPARWHAPSRSPSQPWRWWWSRAAAAGRRPRPRPRP